MSEFNLDLASRVLDHITLHPDQHQQPNYRSCVVGWTLRLANDRDRQVVRDYTGGLDCGGSAQTAAVLLGIPRLIADDIYGTMGNGPARRKLQRLVDVELKRRRKVAEAQEKAVKAEAKQAKVAAKRAARVEEETQRALDLQAREQVRAHARTPVEELTHV